MNKTIVAAAALLTGVAVGVPVLAWSADNPAPAAQPGPGAPGMGPHGGMGGMGHPGWMGRMGMHRTMAMSPQQRCEEHLARRAGMAAYVVAKLDLTAQQRPLWDKVQGVMQANADKERQRCATLKPADQASFLDRMNQREQALNGRLQAMQQAKPAVEALYQALTPAQKAIVDHPFRRQ